MAFGVGNLGNIVQDFKNSLNQIFGAANNSVSANKGSDEKLFNTKVGGTSNLETDKWIGNAGAKKNKVKYGFATLKLSNITGGGFEDLYFLDIPPQSIMQKEAFATNIQATRKGVIVETEGVVFRDIIIQGTTGIYPGKRGEYNSQGPNYADFTAPPSAPQGVKAETGRSTFPSETVISGYEEFIRLRQFFLAYAQEKVESDGDLFLVFINQKDNQTIIVEPLEFTMERSSKSPMTYNYKIVLKGIGDLGRLFSTGDQIAVDDPVGFLEKVGNVAANVQAAIKQGRAVFNQSIRLLTRISQSVDQTVNGTLRQLQFATEDVKDGLGTVLSLPTVLLRNATDSILTIRENIENGIPAVVENAKQKAQREGERLQSAVASDPIAEAASFNANREVLKRLEQDSRDPLPRTFVENSKAQLNSLADNLSDFVGLGDPLYDQVKGRTSTLVPDALKVVSDDEFILLGQLANVSNSLNLLLATNVGFQPDAEIAFEQASSEFESQNINIKKPKSVKEITIRQTDTLERIAQREYGDALRWIDIVVLNSLKPPYISSTGGDGVLKPGDKLLIGVD